MFAQLRFESLENRWVPATFTNLDSNGLWDDANNWDITQVPGALDDVTIPDGYTVTGSASDTTVQSLSLSGDLNLSHNLSLSAASTIAATGTLTISSSAATVDGSGSLTVDGSITNNQPNSTLTIGIDSITINGSLVASGAAAEVSFLVPTLTNYSASTLTGGAWNAASGGIILFNNASGISTLGSGTSFTLDGASSHYYSTGTNNALASFANLGSGSTFYIKNSASLSVSAGTDAGTWANDGTLTFTGSNTFNTGTAFSGSGSVTFNSGTQTFNDDVTIANPFTNSGATLSPASSKTLTLSGTKSFTAGTLAGSGTVALSGTTTQSLNTTVSGLVTNSGTYNLTGGQMSLNSPGVFTNAAGATLSISSSANPGITGGGSFINSGLVQATAAGNDQSFSVNNWTNNSTGEFRAAANGRTFQLPLGSGTSNGGLFSASAGAILNISGGAATFGAGSTFGGAGTVQINAGTYNVTGNVSSVGGVSFVSGSASVNISNGITWTLTGANQMNALNSSGTGVFLNNGTLSVTVPPPSGIPRSTTPASLRSRVRIPSRSEAAACC